MSRFVPMRADHLDPVAGVGQRPALLPHPPVERHREVLDEHQHVGTGAGRLRHRVMLAAWRGVLEVWASSRNAAAPIPQVTLGCSVLETAPSLWRAVVPTREERPGPVRGGSPPHARRPVAGKEFRPMPPTSRRRGTRAVIVSLAALAACSAVAQSAQAAMIGDYSRRSAWYTNWASPSSRIQEIPRASGPLGGPPDASLTNEIRVEMQDGDPADAVRPDGRRQAARAADGHRVEHGRCPVGRLVGVRREVAGREQGLADHLPGQAGRRQLARR